MLRPIAEGVWGMESEIAVGAGITLPCRGTLLRLVDGSLAIHSPIGIDDVTAAEISALGDVRWLIAPNASHWMFVTASKARFPGARVLAAPSLRPKLGDLRFDGLPERGEIAGIEGGLLVRLIEGAPRMSEHVFLHVPSKTLLVSDLLFNIQGSDKWFSRLFFRLTGIYQKTAQSFAWRMLVKDKPAASRSAADLLGWDFERIVVAHGDVVDGHARDRAQGALRWMLGGAPHLLG